MYSTLSATPTVTVVDDEPAALNALVRAAECMNLQCQTAVNAEQALAILEKTLTPVVVTDLRMPGLGGVWLVREIRKRWPKVAVIVLTALHEMDAMTQCLDAGAHQYFLKPINFNEFHHALQAALTSQRQKQEQERRHGVLEQCLRRQHTRLRRTYLAAINSLVRLLEARDPYTCGHSLRVCTYAARLAAKLGLADTEQAHVQLAAKLHDIGKVALPESILNKPGPLSPEEFLPVRKHPVIAERILAPTLRKRAVLAAIRGHHERWDGLGYPDNLRGGNIPLAARMLAVADCFDALTSHRAYRAAMCFGDAVAVLRKEAGTKLDPELVPVFIDLIENETEPCLLLRR
ncbi:MAG: response regulator [Gemmataceae bacterium]|nr:response regulator [Gemmataceae bacterium]MCI0742958.1 response regulator [Gemmataceae bacterium]